jgi:hypothetical protein
VKIETRNEMETRAAGVTRAEQIKWWDACDALSVWGDEERFEEGLSLARESDHPDAQWLVSQVPGAGDVNHQRMSEVMRGQVDDARASFFAWLFGAENGLDLLTRAAEAGYAQAQAQLAAFAVTGEDEFKWSQKAASAGDRNGLFELANCYSFGQGCAEDEAKALELYREAAELDCPAAQVLYAEAAFAKTDWEWFHWRGRAAERRVQCLLFVSAVLELLPAFEKFMLARIMHTAASAMRRNLDQETQRFFYSSFLTVDMARVTRVLELHDALLGRARRAIDCWSVVGRRHGVSKDMRVMIAKMAWEDPWRWGDKE